MEVHWQSGLDVSVSARKFVLLHCALSISFHNDHKTQILIGYSYGCSFILGILSWLCLALRIFQIIMFLYMYNIRMKRL
jgi:hypothetical protein